MHPKKRKADESSSASNNDNNAKKPKPLPPGGYEALSLPEIKQRILGLMDRVPSADDDLSSETQVYNWAATLQAVIEEFNLVACLIAAATYKWGSDRSGAADQNLALLSGELQASQEQISATVTPRLSNILAPVVDLVIDKSVSTHSSDKEKVKQNVFTQKQVDPAFCELCRTILRRNAKMIRQVVLANFLKVATCIGDFCKAQEKDSQHDSRGFSY